MSSEPSKHHELSQDSRENSFDTKWIQSASNTYLFFKVNTLCKRLVEVLPSAKLRSYNRIKVLVDSFFVRFRPKPVRQGRPTSIWSAEVSKTFFSIVWNCRARRSTRPLKFEILNQFKVFWLVSKFCVFLKSLPMTNYCVGFLWASTVWIWICLVVSVHCIHNCIINRFLEIGQTVKIARAEKGLNFWEVADFSSKSESSYSYCGATMCWTLLQIACFNSTRVISNWNFQ